MTQDANVILADMPSTIHSYVVANNDFTYTVIINSRLCKETQIKAYHHEMEHIENGDYEKRSADLIEFYAHKEEKDGRGIKEKGIK